MARKQPKLDALSLNELIALRDRIDAAIADRASTEQKELQARLQLLAELAGRRPSRARRRAPARTGARRKKAHPLKGRKAAPKYIGPNKETWSGRGLAPKWLVALEAKGRKRESFLIKR